MNAYFVRALWGNFTHIFREREFAAIGWFKTELEDHSNRQSIVDHYRKEFPGESDARTYQNSGQIYRFWNRIKEGDIIITTYSDGSLLIGKAVGEPYFEKDDFEFYERIKVKWNDHCIDRSQLSIGLQNTLRSSLTVFSVSQVEEIAETAGFKIEKSDMRITPKFDYSILNEEIRKVILTLDPSEFELLVSKVLQTLGFEATQETGRVGDKGIDYEGVLEVNGVASVKLQVQVKRYENNKVNGGEIRNFRGSLKRDYQGTFITLSKFSKSAISGANDPYMEPIKLINGKQFVDLFVLQYDEIIKLLNEEDNDILADKLQFKRTLIPL